MKRLVALFLFHSSIASAQIYDIEHQTISIELGDMTAIELTAQLQVTTPGQGLDILRPLLPLDAVLIDGQPANFGPHPQYPQQLLRVEWPSPGAGASEVTMRMMGVLDCASPAAPGALRCYDQNDKTILVPTDGSGAWYLLNLYSTDPFTAQINIRAPNEREARSGQGRSPVLQDHQDGTTTYTFEFVHPTELMWAYAGPPAIASNSGVLGFFAGEGAPPAQLGETLALADGVMDYLSDTFGELPGQERSLIVIPGRFPFAGTGMMNNVLIAEYIFGDFDYILDQGIAHEFAHSWWGNLANASDRAVFSFFGEAFAEYSAWRALGHLRGDAERVTGRRMNAVWYMYRRPQEEDIAILDPQVTESPAFVHVTYHKGSAVLSTLEHAVGEASFSDALRNFLQRGPGGLSIEALLEDIQAASGYDATVDVAQWLRQPGFPSLRINAAQSVEGLELDFELNRAYALKIPVRLTFLDGTTEQRELRITPSSRSHTLDLTRPIINCTIDPNWTMAREIIPGRQGDVTLDGQLDANDLIEVALNNGRVLPNERRRDGRYDPLFDVDQNRVIDDRDLLVLEGLISR